MDSSIKSVEQIIPLAKEYETFKMFSKFSILKHQQKYKYLHLGLVQITVKPLTREGLNTSVLLCLRDKRQLQYKDSLLGTVEISLSNGANLFWLLLKFYCLP